MLAGVQTAATRLDIARRLRLTVVREPRVAIQRRQSHTLRDWEVRAREMRPKRGRARHHARHRRRIAARFQGAHKIDQRRVVLARDQ